jgi:hypothetical protein
VNHLGSASTGAAGKPTDARLEAEVALDKLIQILESSVDTHSWRANGGTEGAARALGERIFVTQTLENHIRVAGFFSALRASATLPQTRPAKVAASAETAK